MPEGIKPIATCPTAPTSGGTGVTTPDYCQALDSDIPSQPDIPSQTVCSDIPVNHQVMLGLCLGCGKCHKANLTDKQYIQHIQYIQRKDNGLCLHIPFCADKKQCYMRAASKVVTYLNSLFKSGDIA